jgi:NAD+ synthase
MVYRITEDQVKKVVDRGSRFLANYCINGNIHYVVTGSSGGTDSAVTLGFAQRACALTKEKGFNLTSVALILPCESEDEDVMKGYLAARKFGAEPIVLDIEPAFGSVMEYVVKRLNSGLNQILEETGGEDALYGWDWSSRVAQGNVKARLRMITLYHAARMLNGMVLSTDNLSEYWMGFWTICGDVGDFNLIQNIMKGKELYDIAKYLGVPGKITSAKPGDGLKVGGTAEDQLGADYPMIDTIMVKLIQSGFDPNGSISQLKNLPQMEGIAPDILAKVATRCLRGTYKRQGTVIISREELGLLSIKDIRL